MIQGPGQGTGMGAPSRVAPSHGAARSNQPRKKVESVHAQAPSPIGQDHPLIGAREGPGQEGLEGGRQA